MATDALSLWKSEWDNLPLDPTGLQGPLNIAQYVGDRLSGKLEFALPVVGSLTFTFGVAAMAAALAGAVPDVSPVVGATKMATAWQAGMLASIVVVGAGTYTGTPTPATTFSAPPVATPGPGIAAAYTTLLADILGLAPSEHSELPDKLRAASLSCDWILTGINSIVPTPTPLIITAGVM